MAKQRRKLVTPSKHKKALPIGTTSIMPNSVAASATSIETFLDHHRFVYIEGPSGCGKTYQVVTALENRQYATVQEFSAKNLALNIESGEIDFLSPTCDSDNLIIWIKEIGYLNSVEMACIFAFIRSRLGLVRDKIVTSKCRLIVTSSVPMKKLKLQDNYFNPLMKFLDRSRIEISGLNFRQNEIERISYSLLTRHTHRFNKPHIQTIASEVINDFKQYAWPGNIRELDGLIKVAVSRSTTPELSKQDFSVFYKYAHSLDTVSVDA